MKPVVLSLILFLLGYSFAAIFLTLGYAADDDDGGEGSCTKECLANTYLDCPTFVDFDHCQNCCTIKPSECSLKFTNNGSVACEGEGGFCPLYCLEDTVVQCGDVIYTDRCWNCCTVQFTNCAIKHASNASIICQGIGFEPWNRGTLE